MAKTAAKIKKTVLPGRSPVLPVARKSSPPVGVEKTVTPLWTNFGKALEDLPGLVAEVARLNALKKELDEQIVPYNLAIKGLMESVDDSKSWSCRDLDADWVAIYIKPNPSKRLMPELLIQQGVTMKQIQKATKETPKKPYVQVRKLGDKSRNSEGDEE